MKSLRHHAGYMIIDHSNSPGLKPSDVAHIPGAKAVGEGQVYERDVLMCSHCQRAIVLNPLRVRDRGYCGKCNHYVCDSCETIRVRTNECVPMVKLIDQAQSIAEKYVGQPDHPANRPDSVLVNFQL